MRAGWARALGLLALLAGGAACTDLPLENGKLMCSVDQRCPPDYVCACDRCWRTGTAPNFCPGDDMATADKAACP